MVTHEQLLNTMLSNTCTARSNKSTGLRLFIFDLHCNELWIVARFTPNREEETYEYTIVDRKLANNRSKAEMNEWVNTYEWDN